MYLIPRNLLLYCANEFTQKMARTAKNNISWGSCSWWVSFQDSNQKIGARNHGTGIICSFYRYPPIIRIYHFPYLKVHFMVLPLLKWTYAVSPMVLDTTIVPKRSTQAPYGAPMPRRHRWLSPWSNVDVSPIKWKNVRYNLDIIHWGYSWIYWGYSWIYWGYSWIYWGYSWIYWGYSWIYWVLGI